jgi:hypothetical protein
VKRSLLVGVCAVGIVLALSACGSPATPAQRADRVIQIQRDLGLTPYSRAMLLGDFLSHTPGGLSCSRADDDGFHRQELQQSTGFETPDHWTRIEAGYIAGACPSKLRPFFASLDRIGEQVAADGVKAALARIGVRA